MVTVTRRPLRLTLAPDPPLHLETIADPQTFQDLTVLDELLRRYGRAQIETWIGQLARYGA